MLMGIRLHPRHTESCQGSVPEPLLATDVALALMGKGGGVRGRAQQFLLGLRGGCLCVLGSNNVVLAEVPLFLTILRLGRESAAGPPLLALDAPLDPKVVPVPLEARRVSSTSRSPNGWLLVAETEESCHRAVVAFAAEGVLRTDFEDAFYLEDQILGVGGFGTVRRARVRQQRAHLKEKLDYVVVKCVSDETLTQSPPKTSPGQVREVVTATGTGSVSSEGGVPKSVRTEVQFMLKAQGHPHIMVLHGLFRNSGGAWALVLDCCAGGDLFALVGKVGLLGEAACSALMDGLLGALGHLHGISILHRDVKPENLLLHAGGRPVLGDFGLACGAEDAQEARRRIGSPGFIAPEVLKGQGATGKADVFSAGATLYFACMGTTPFNSKDMASTLHKTLTENISFQSQAGRLSPVCRKFAESLLTKRPQDRPTALEAMADPWFSGDTNSASKLIPASAPQPVAPPARPISAQGRPSTAGPRRQSSGGRHFVQTKQTLDATTADSIRIPSSPKGVQWRPSPLSARCASSRGKRSGPETPGAPESKCSPKDMLAVGPCMITACGSPSSAVIAARSARNVRNDMIASKKAGASPAKGMLGPVLGGGCDEELLRGG